MGQQITMRTITFYKLAADHKIGYQNSTGVMSYKVGKEIDETIHVIVEHAGYDNSIVQNFHTSLVNVKAQTELGTLFVQLLGG